MKNFKRTNLVAVLLAMAFTLSTTVFVVGSSVFASAETSDIVSDSVVESNGDSETLKHQCIDSFLRDGQEIIYETELYDFDGNLFILYELSPAGYAIYSIKGEASTFVEGALSSNSPFFEYLDQNLVYLGFGSYYYENSGSYIDILTGESYAQSALPQGYYLAESAYYEATQEEVSDAETDGTSFPSEPDEKVTVNLDGYVQIADHDYFDNLTKFPKNTDGTCGLVAICIMLGYLDEYVNDGFIPDNESYEGVLFKNGTGTSQALHDYLFDNCKHTILGISDSGYPMANGEIKSTMKDYLENICGTSFENNVEYISGSVFNTHKNPRKHINAGHPTLITMTSYNSTYSSESTTTKSTYHTVVAYGYNKEEDTFLVHIGWNPGTTKGTQIVVSNATIYSYNTFLYNE